MRTTPIISTVDRNDIREEDGLLSTVRHRRFVAQIPERRAHTRTAGPFHPLGFVLPRRS